MNNSRQLEIEKITDNIRNEINPIDYGIKDVFEASEKLGYRSIRYPIGEKLFLGFSLIKDSERIIFSNSSLILSREIFTVAHEIGHQELHLSEQGLTLITDEKIEENNDVEKEAYYFARCLLMPFEKVQKFIRIELQGKSINNWDGFDIARIQTAFNVSFELVLVRLNELDILNDNIKNKLSMHKIEITVSKLLNAIGGNPDLCKATSIKKVPANFLEWVLFNYEQKLISKKALEDALSYIDLKADDFDYPPEEIEEEESIDDLIRGMN